MAVHVDKPRKDEAADGRSALIAAQNTPSACTNLLGCLINTTVTTLIQLVNGIGGRLTTAVANLATPWGSRGVLTQSILKDVLGPKVAQARLDLVEAGCVGRSRLVQ